MPDDIFDRVAAKAPKQDIFDQVASAKSSSIVPDPVAQARARFQPGGAGANIVQPTRFAGAAPTSAEDWYTKPTPDVSPNPALSAQESEMPYSNTPQQALHRGMAINAAMGAPALVSGAIAAPLATAGGVAGGMAGGYAGKKGAQLLGGGQLAQDISEGAGGLIGGSVGAGIGSAGPKAVARGLQFLRGESPERIAELQSLFPKETALNRAVDTAESQSRQAFKGAYDALGIDAAPVEMTAAKNAARQAAQSLPKTAASVPRPVGTVAALPEPSEANLADYILSRDNPTEILSALSKSDTIPFRQAQQTRAALESYISRARGGLPPETYNALKSVSNAIGGQLEKTAANEGKLGAYQAADQMFKQHAADFWNKNAPLKPYLNVPEGREGSFNKFLQTADRSRALDALQRRGVPTEDLQNLLSQYGGSRGSDKWQGTLKDARLLRDAGVAALNQQAATANRKAALGYALKGAGVTGGVGAGLAEVYRLLSTGQQKTP